jgi:hypothetical protein
MEMLALISDAPFVKPFKVGPKDEGSSLSVECIVDPGNPILTTYLWRRKLNSSLENSWYGIPDSSTIGNQLVKQNISKNDAGLYNCTASNNITQTSNQQKTGSSSETFLLDVLCKNYLFLLVRIKRYVIY